MSSSCLLIIIPFIYGTLLGSFFNVCIYRLPRSRSIVWPSSACPACKEPILWRQNIPVLSYVLLGGRCASCGTPISLRYPVIEILTGILTAFLWRRDWPFAGVFACDVAFFGLLLVITVMDWDFQVIFDSTVYLGTAVGFWHAFLVHRLAESALTAAGAALFFYSVRVVGEFVFLREALGEGDVKLAAMLGVYLGLKKTAAAVFLSFPIGLAMALALMAVKLKGRKDTIPFGPAMAAAAFLAAFWGRPLLNWYLRFRL